MRSKAVQHRAAPPRCVRSPSAIALPSYGRSRCAVDIGHRMRGRGRQHLRGNLLTRERNARTVVVAAPGRLHEHPSLTLASLNAPRHGMQCVQGAVSMVRPSTAMGNQLAQVAVTAGISLACAGRCAAASRLWRGGVPAQLRRGAHVASILHHPSLAPVARPLRRFVSRPSRPVRS